MGNSPPQADGRRVVFEWDMNFLRFFQEFSKIFSRIFEEFSCVWDFAEDDSICCCLLEDTCDGFLSVGQCFWDDFDFLASLKHLVGWD